jgi:hypothetical protein
MPSYRSQGVDFGPKTRADACKRCPAVCISAHTHHIHTTDTSSCFTYIGKEILQVSGQSQQYRFSHAIVVHHTGRVTVLTNTYARCPAVRISTHTSHFHDTDTSSCSTYMGEEIPQVSAQSEQNRYSRRFVMHCTHRVTAAIQRLPEWCTTRGWEYLYCCDWAETWRISSPMYLEHDDMSVSWM